ncbi:ATP-dependent permease [Rhizina undulata]
MDYSSVKELDSRLSLVPEEHESSEEESDEKAKLVSSKMKDPVHKGWLSLFGFVERKHLYVFGAAVSFSVVSGCVGPGLSILMGKIFGAFSSYGSGDYDSWTLVHEVRKYVIILAGLGAANWFLTCAFFSCWLMFGELQAKSARESLFEGLIVREIEWYDKRKTGVTGLVSRCQTQVKELQTAVSQPFGYVIQAVVTTIASLGTAFYYSWSLTLVILAGIPIALGILAFLSSRVQPNIDAQKEHLTDATKVLSRGITAIEIVKAFNGQEHELKNYSAVIARAAKAFRNQASYSSLQIGVIRFMMLSMFVQGFWYGSVLVRKSDGAQSGDVMTTFWSCLMATQSLEMIIPQFLILEKGRAAGAMLKSLLFRVESGRVVRDMRGGIIPHKCHGKLEIKNVSFAYPSRPDQLALDNVSFFIPAHETTFIIGKSGSGKSTLGNLILKLYEPRGGTITLDGNPLQVIDSDWLRNNITFVQQQSILFNETIFRNVAFGRKDFENATKEEVQEACRLAILEQTLLDLPQGYDSIIGHGGKQLSGGQRQRIALARARLRDTEVLILDEATSALDYISRSLVMEKIHQWRKGKTTIIITHDIDQIDANDFVYILEKGRVVQEGNRRELERKVGQFQSFVKAAKYQEDKSRRRSSVISSNSESEMDFDDSSFEISPLESSQNSLTEFSSSGNKHSRLSVYARGRNERPVSTLNPIAHLQQPPGIELADLSTSAKNSREIRRSAQMGSRSRRMSLRADNSEISLAEAVQKHKRRFPRRFSKQEKPKKPSLLRILGTIWPVLSFWPRVFLILGFVAALAHASSTPVFSFALAKLLDSFFDVESPISECTKWSLVVLGIAVSDGIASYFLNYLLDSVGQSWVDTLRVEALKRILQQPRGWFDREKNNVSRITEDMEKNGEEMKYLLGRFAGYTFVCVIMTSVGLIWSFTECWQLTLVGVSIAPIMYAITKGFSWVADKWESKSNLAAENIGVVFDETITNIRGIRTLSLERYFREKYLSNTAEAIEIGLRRAFYSGVGYGLADSTIMFATATIFYYGAILVGKEMYGLAEILIVFTILLFCLSNANGLVSLIPQMSNSKDTAKRVLRLANLPLDSHENDGALRRPYKGAIRFHDVDFSYPSRPETLVLRNINFKIRAGECVAIVGLSGSGKSTIAALLQRLYPTLAGIITIDGRSISSLEISALRSQMAIVSQTATLFDCSVFENICYGMKRGTFSHSQVELAARSAGIHDFIMGLPEGYSTALGDNGSALSGGQAQRIAIARALVRRPRVLILDECTSNLDAESARVVQETIQRLVRGEDEYGEIDLARGMSVIIITHSREMMRCAQRVIVMNSGEIVESGNFDDLLGSRGELTRLLSKGEWAD